VRQIRPLERRNIHATPQVFPSDPIRRRIMGKGILLWLLGVPIPIILLLWLFFH
jgi:hypothetical protein